MVCPLHLTSKMESPHGTCQFGGVGEDPPNGCGFTPTTPHTRSYFKRKAQVFPLDLLFRISISSTIHVNRIPISYSHQRDTYRGNHAPLLQIYQHHRLRKTSTQNIELLRA